MLEYDRIKARWWEKYLLKRSPLKHTCSWRDKLIVLWIMNRQAKIFLRISKGYLVESVAPEVLCKMGAPKYLGKFIWKHKCWILLQNKIAACRQATSFKTGLLHRCFPVKLWKLFKTAFCLGTPSLDDCLWFS